VLEEAYYMPYFTKSQDKKLLLPSNQDYWVVVKTELSWKETKIFAANKDKNDITHSLDIMLSSLITSWNLDDDKGKVLDINQENLDMIKKSDVEAIIACINESLGEESEDPKETS
jgi:hypothetical protein